jgi:hypothetical protein
MADKPAARSKKSKQAQTPQQLKKQERNRQYHQNNRDKALQRMCKRYAALTPAERTLRNWRQKARPSMPKPGSFRARDPRNIAVAQAYCDWSDIDEVVRTHIAAAVMTELTGEPYVVDHTVPLSNPFVCGLHTHTNLQVITAEENSRKQNLLWPEMWPVSWESLEILQKPC